MKPIAPCVLCKHMHVEKLLKGQGMTCAAFPDGVPQRIVQGMDQHQSPYPGDHGIQFEERELEVPSTGVSELG